MGISDDKSLGSNTFYLNKKSRILFYTHVIDTIIESSGGYSVAQS